jgi:hypothetical protein
MNTKQNVAVIAAGILMSSAFLSQANPILLDRTPRSFDAAGNTFVPTASAFAIHDTLAVRFDVESAVTSGPAQTDNDTLSKDDSQRSFLFQATAIVGSRAAAFEGRQKLDGRINYSGPQPAGFGVTDSTSTVGLLVLACLGLVLLSRRLNC